MISSLGVPVVLCSALGGETGNVIGHLLPTGSIEVRSVARVRRGGRVSGVRGHHEWGVKAFAAARPDVEPANNDPALGPGAAYLFCQRAAHERAARVRREMRDAVEELHERLAAAASASRRYPPQDPSLSGRREDMVLNAAYLVEVGRSTAVFTSGVETWLSPLIEVTLTGPWPPYSFAVLEEP